MKNIVILGAGTAGTMMANKLVTILDHDEWLITIVDHEKEHYYQPGFLFLPFDIYSERDVKKPKETFLPSSVRTLFSPIELIQPDNNQVQLTSGDTLTYDVLIVATGSRIVPEETEGLAEGGWRKNIFDFYTFDGAVALRDYLRHWKGGKLVVNIVEMPIKCPVAPLEFVFLADWWFTERNIRDKVDIEFVTPLPSAFTKPRAAHVFGDFLEKKGIKLVPDFNTGRVDWERNKIISWDEKEIEYDLLVTIPTNMGQAVIERSGMGDELNFIPTNKHTLQSENWKNVFVIGDATNLPSSKAGSVAHFQADVLLENIQSFINGEELRASFDGHANCYIESGFGKGILIDFNYDTEPLPGKFPLPGVGPFSLLKETEINHYGKILFKWMYWNLLLKGAELPIQSKMQMAGKIK
jgi:sulfide:quinone oxidoreductase